MPRIMIFEFADYRSYLKQTALARKAKNPSYSLRAMAQQLSLAPSTFSEVMNGKKNLSLETASLVAHKLGLKGKEADYFCLLVQIESARDIDFKESLQKKLRALNPQKHLHNFTVDAFKMMSDWYHLAILGILNMEGFEFTVASLSKTLGVSKLEIDTALERLERLELIDKDPQGNYRRIAKDLLISSPVPQKSLEHYHRQMMNKALESMSTQPIKERTFRTQNMVIDESQLEQADALLEEFYAKMEALSEKPKRKNRLYHLSTQFFCLAKSGGGKKS